MLFEYVTPGFCLIIYPVIKLHVSVPCHYLEHNTLTILNHTVLPHATLCTRTDLFIFFKPNFNFHMCIFLAGFVDDSSIIWHTLFFSNSVDMLRQC